MKIHTDRLSESDVYEAARIARVDLATFTDHGSRSRDHAYNILLRGESRRAPNQGTARNVNRFDVSEKAATWDQWGVFLSVLFDRDLSMVTPYYTDAEDFHRRTVDRFNPESNQGFWPADAHGDHTFRYSAPGEQVCTKCSARSRMWADA